MQSEYQNSGTKYISFSPCIHSLSEMLSILRLASISVLAILIFITSLNWLNGAWVLAVREIIPKILLTISAKRKTNVSHVREQQEEGCCTREDLLGATVAAAEARCKSHVPGLSRMLITGSISSPRQRKAMNPVQHVSKGSRAARDRLERKLETSWQDRSKIQAGDRAINVYMQDSPAKA